MSDLGVAEAKSREPGIRIDARVQDIYRYDFAKIDGVWCA